MKKLSLLAGGLFLSLMHPADDFWIEPEKFVYQWNESINLRFRTGSAFEGNNWTGYSTLLGSLKLYYSGVEDDLEMMEEAIGDSVQLKLLDEGTCVIALKTVSQSAPYPLRGFHVSLREKEVDSLTNDQVNHDEMSLPAKYTIQHSAKTILQIGNKCSNTAQNMLGLPLDLVPTANPYEVPMQDSIGFSVIYRGRKLPAQQVDIWHREGDIISHRQYRTDSTGLVRFPLSRTGKWKISSCYLERSAVDSLQSEFLKGSCTWGYY